MTEQYEMGVFVMDTLEKLGFSYIDIGEFIDDKNLEKSFTLLKELENFKESDTEQYKIGTLVVKFLEKLDMHPITIAEAVTDLNYKESFKIIMKNPNITKKNFLQKMSLKEEIDY